MAVTEGFDDVAGRITALSLAVDRDAALRRRGRCLDTTCELDIGEAAFLLRIIDGRVVEVRRGPFVTPSADFAMIAQWEVWERLLTAEPRPGDQDFLAFVKRGEMRLAGNLHPLMSHLLYFKGLLACLRAEAQ